MGRGERGGERRWNQYFGAQNAEPVMLRDAGFGSGAPLLPLQSTRRRPRAGVEEKNKEKGTPILAIL